MCPLPPTSSKVALGSRSATRRPCAWGASTSSSPCLRPSDNAIVPSRVSPGIGDTGLERPLRKPAHFERFVGRRVALRTAAEIAGRKRFKGELIGADEQAVHLATEPQPVDIPYEQIVRGNLIDEGNK